MTVLIRGYASHTLSHGKVVFAEGMLDVARGAGHYVKRLPLTNYGALTNV